MDSGNRSIGRLKMIFVVIVANACVANVGLGARWRRWQYWRGAERGHRCGGATVVALAVEVAAAGLGGL
eukprot:1223337-Pyramimonas_sp.AAC.1